MIHIEPKTLFFAVILLLTMPLQWLLSAAFAAAFHELCHFGVLKLLGVPIYKLQIGILGSELQAAPGNSLQEFLSTAAGPAGSILLCLMYRWIPKIAICAGIQVVFNLLPIYPMDGGRLLRLLLEKTAPQRALKIGDWIETGVIGGMAIGSLLLSHFYSLGIFPLLLSLAVIFRGFSRKRPCKQGQNRVQ